MDRAKSEMMLKKAAEEARAGLAEGGIPIGARGDRCVPARGAAEELSRQNHGDHSRAVLVLQRADSAVRNWSRGGGGIGELPWRNRLAAGEWS